MPILVDEQDYAATGPTDQTVRLLAQEVCTAADGGRQRVVTDLRCDGQTISEQELDAVLDTPVHCFERIEILTCAVAGMVRATLTQAIHVFEDAAATRETIADLLAEGQQQAAMTKLGSLFEVWKQVQQSMVICAEAMQTDLDAIRVGEQSLADILGPIKQQLSDLKDAIESGDFVLVSDILRYELSEPFEQWIAFLNQLRDTSIA